MQVNHDYSENYLPYNVRLPRFTFVSLEVKQCIIDPSTFKNVTLIFNNVFIIINTTKM